MTQLELARDRQITDEMRAVADAEGVDADALRQHIVDGTVVIPANRARRAGRVTGIGTGLRTKVNANIGTSMDRADIEEELDKLAAAQDAGADAVMDLSTGGDIGEIRRKILEKAEVSFGTVPIYEAAIRAAREKGAVSKMTEDDMLDSVRQHAADGVDFVTVHCGLTTSSIKHLKQHKRVCGIVSRGGTFLVDWMLCHEKENPLYTRFDELCAIAGEHDVTLSLGDALRPGAIADAGDRAQIDELLTMAELAARARAKGVQVMLEGPGHVPLDKIVPQIKMQKDLTGGLPFYVLGPIVTDVAPGYDHITSAIGGALAASAGADFLCYVTPAEHLSLPTPDDVRTGVISARIAAHAADIAKGLPGATDWDDEMSRARRARDWEKQLDLAIDPVLAEKFHNAIKAKDGKSCSMCGEFCAFNVVDRHFG